MWKARNPAAIDDFVIDDFVLTTGGVDVVSRTKFEEWAAGFMAKINDQLVRSDEQNRIVRPRKILRAHPPYCELTALSTSLL